MKSVAENLQDIYPLMFRPVNDLSKKDKENITNKVVLLKNKFESLKDHFNSKKVNFKISHRVISKYMKDMEQVFENGHFYFGQKMLQGLPNICISCHTQDRRFKSVFQSLNRKKFPSDLLFADFLFSVRDYTRSLSYYDRFLKSNSSDKNEMNVSKALFRKLLYFVEIKEDLIKAKTLLKDSKKNTLKTPGIQSRIKGWTLALVDLEKEKNIASFQDMKRILKKMTFDNLLSYGGERLKMHYWQNKLSFYLHSKASIKEVPEILFWLGRLERKTEDNIFYSFADLYLRECVHSYTGSSIAKKCYEEYKDHVIFSFTGTRGTDLPSDVQNELDAMRKSLKIK